MAAVLPGAEDVATFWANSLNGFDAITEIPADRWDWRLYYDPDPKAPDKVYSKWGGFLPDVPFDPLRYGMPPASLPSIEPAQLLALEVARAALDRRRLRRSGLSRASARPSSWAWGVERPRLPWVTPSDRICRCSTRSSPGGGTTATGALPGTSARMDGGFLSWISPQRDRRPHRQPA